MMISQLAIGSALPVLKFAGTTNNLNGESGAIDETAAIRESFPIVGAPFAAGCVSANESLFTGG